MPAIQSNINFSGGRIRGLSKPASADEPVRRMDLTGEEDIGDGGGTGGGGGFAFSVTAPASPTDGFRWLDANSGIMYTYVNDGTSSQWVEL